jgi:hypothetical protein
MVFWKPQQQQQHVASLGKRQLNMPNTKTHFCRYILIRLTQFFEVVLYAPSPPSDPAQFIIIEEI